MASKAYHKRILAVSGVPKGSLGELIRGLGKSPFRSNLGTNITASIWNHLLPVRNQTGRGSGVLGL